MATDIAAKLWTMNNDYLQVFLFVLYSGFLVYSWLESKTWFKTWSRIYELALSVKLKVKAKGLQTYMM